MIPISENEKIPYTDKETGVIFELLPMVGSNEYQAQAILKKLVDANSQSEDPLEFAKINDSLFDLFVAGWSHPTKTDLSPFPDNKKPSTMFNMAFKKAMVFDVILKINSLSSEEKKS